MPKKPKPKTLTINDLFLLVSDMVQENKDTPVFIYNDGSDNYKTIRSIESDQEQGLVKIIADSKVDVLALERIV